MAEASAGTVPRTALVLLAAITLLWGINWVAMKAAVVELSPWTFRAGCLILASAGLMALAWVTGERLRVPREAIGALIFVSLCNVTAWNMLSAFALTRIGGGRAAIVAYTMPLWAVLLGVWLLGESVTPRRIMALVIGLAGMAILMGADLLAIGESPVGTLLMVLAALAWAAGTVFLKRRRDWGLGALGLSAWQMTIGGIPILLAWLVLAPPLDLDAVSWRGVSGMVYAGLVGLVFCFTAFQYVVRLVPASVASIGTLGIPIVGVAASALLLGEPIGANEFVALALVLAALALILLPGRRRT